AGDDGLLARLGRPHHARETQGAAPPAFCVAEKEAMSRERDELVDIITRRVMEHIARGGSSAPAAPAYAAPAAAPEPPAAAPRTAAAAHDAETAEHLKTFHVSGASGP